ncbi:MAG: penicillin-binding protein activator [Gammaproteobacteria bacterium]|jgi:outer membrane PBP1 activator LpoA protein|nr:penicillin-binding protein activator [Gammaproteobacteria bacterium]
MDSTLTQPYQNLRRALPLLLLTATLAGCSTLSTGTAPDATDRARALAGRGDHMAASRAYMDLAVASKGTQQQRYLLLAAGELYQANDLGGAERVLDRAGAAIDPDNLGLWVEVQASVELARGRPDSALQALNEISTTASRGAALRVLLLRSEALFQLNKPAPAVATLLQREQLLTEPAAVAENRRLIWKGLQRTGPAITEPAPDSRAGRDPIALGWLELGQLAYAQRGSVNRLYGALEQWRQAHPEHPASTLLAEEVLVNLRALSDYPPQVALLLPLTGPQRAIGQAIRDGYLTAHFDIGSNSERPDVRIYDTAPDGAVAAYQRAALDGAAFVIGPLLKEEVSAVSAVSTLTTLALNTIDGGGPANPSVFQFALAPEDEARAAAIRATENGLLNAVVLVPDSDRGLRILAAFQTELQGRGGQVLAARRYDPAETDFSNTLTSALLIDESYARRDRLAANLGKALQFEPRRRQDIDFIFVAGNTTSAKLIKPQLRFYYAGDIPTYATSEVYTPGSSDNRDINGIVFPDIPWLLEPGPAIREHKNTFEELWGSSAARFGRFYALGYDAYHLSAALQGRTHSAEIELDGLTGKLYVDANGVLHRRLKWARIERGVPATLPDTPQTLGSGAENLAQEATLPPAMR